MTSVLIRETAASQTSTAALHAALPQGRQVVMDELRTDSETEAALLAPVLHSHIRFKSHGLMAPNSH